MRNISVPENYGFDIIICVISTGSPLPHPTFTDARGAHINGIRGTTIHISYSENLDLTLPF